MDAWQLQCCGEPFKVGSRIRWTLTADHDLRFLADVLGDEVSARVTHREDHHGGVPEDTLPVEGVVRSILAVGSRDGVRPDRHGGVSPRRGTGTVTSVTSARGQDPDRPGARLVGYVIELDPRTAELAP